MRATGKIQESLCGAWRASPVVSVLDRDTLEVPHNRHPARIRLSGIDCPEKGQTYGKHAAADLAFGKEVTIQAHGYDKYKRIIGDMLLPDGTNVNHELVRSKKAGAG